jgi:hypothetical protein
MDTINYHISKNHKLRPFLIKLLFMNEYKKQIKKYNKK